MAPSDNTIDRPQSAERLMRMPEARLVELARRLGLTDDLNVPYDALVERVAGRPALQMLSLWMLFRVSCVQWPWLLLSECFGVHCLAGIGLPIT